ncbi:hypothetical protein ASPBRDRAFT_66890 [Aspergillus brasiliensis CBS 101740]|uniref:Aminotransferase class I/classII large domain-containing protein n=1 Tax=Aspergillus brasiliensis (strain CBS 101740 / IMI 381727 / IBT 21946) TaxID=767769 RepID=A0A1L9UDS6_ASPBC|nr:hypothetical protein ASPBRDRAFT_66890 [Aspergillus brasiliensis CBS 101740]
MGAMYDTRLLFAALVPTPLSTQSPEALRGLAAFRGRHQLHFISDEIYAKSVFANAAIATPIPFISASALGLCDVIDPTRSYVLYGISNDFGANGLRCGLISTKK